MLDELASHIQLKSRGSYYCYTI